MLISTLTYTPQPDVNVCHVPCAGVGPYQWLVMLTCGEWACGERVALWANAARPDAAQNPERQATTQNFERLWFLKILCRTPPPRAAAAWLVSQTSNPSCCLFLKIRCAAVQYPDVRSHAHRVGECNGCYRNHVAVLHLPGMPAPSSHLYIHPTPNRMPSGEEQ